MFREVVNQFNTELILPSDLHDTVSMTQQVNTEQVDFDGELMLNEMVARKLRRGNENRCARHAMERAVKETPMKSKKNARQKHAQYVRAQRQKDQSKYMKGRHMQSRQKATIGSIVTLKMDYRDVSNPHGIPAIVFALSTNELGRGIQAVTDHGIICSGKGRNEKIYFIPQERYIVHPNEAVISPYLNEKRQAILDGTFACENYRKMSMQQAHALCYPQDSKSKQRCRCLKECTNACGCFKEKHGCSVSCKCSAKCMNKFNKQL